MGIPRGTGCRYLIPVARCPVRIKACGLNSAAHLSTLRVLILRFLDIIRRYCGSSASGGADKRANLKERDATAAIFCAGIDLLEAKAGLSRGRVEISRITLPGLRPRANICKVRRGVIFSRSGVFENPREIFLAGEENS